MIHCVGSTQQVVKVTIYRRFRRWPSRPIRSLWYIVNCTRIRSRMASSGEGRLICLVHILCWDRPFIYSCGHLVIVVRGWYYTILLCKAKMQYRFTCQVSSCCLLTFHGRLVLWISAHRRRPPDITLIGRVKENTLNNPLSPITQLYPHVIICTSFISSRDCTAFIVLKCHLYDYCRKVT